MLKFNGKYIGSFNLASTFVILLIFAFTVILLSTNSNVEEFKNVENDIKSKFLEEKKSEVKLKIHKINLLIENIKNVTSNTTKKDEQKFIINLVEKINKTNKYPIIIAPLEKEAPYHKYYKELTKKGELFIYDKNFEDDTNNKKFIMEYITLNKEYNWVISTKFEDNILHNQIALWNEHLDRLVLDNIYVHIALLFFFSIALLLVVYVLNKFSNQSLDKCKKVNLKAQKELTYKIHVLEQQIKEGQQKYAEQKKVVQKQSKMLALGEMLSNLSNQWRQPLDEISKTSLKIREKIEKHQITTHEDIEHLIKIDNQASYLARTIDDFKTFLKADSLKIDFVVNEIIEKSLAINESIIKKNNIKVVREFDQSIMIRNLSFGLLQALVNIIYNAKDALKMVPIDERFIFITTKIHEKTIEITFTDTGRGIPNDIMTEIFKPYFTTKEKTYGTGLGLHMAHNIIEQNMSGKLTVENKTIKYRNHTYMGASFTIVLDKAR